MPVPPASCLLTPQSVSISCPVSISLHTIMSDTAKPSSQLLSAIQSADTKVVLKDVTTVENPAAKHDMAMVGWS